MWWTDSFGGLLVWVTLLRIVCGLADFVLFFDSLCFLITWCFTSVVFWIYIWLFVAFVG